MSKYPIQQLSNGDVIQVYPDNVFRVLFNIRDIAGMTKPVHCNHCGKNYDLTEAKLVHRYQDCDLFKTLCCNKLADTRNYKSFPDFTEIVGVIGTPIG